MDGWAYKDEGTLDLSLDAIRKTQGRKNISPVQTSLGNSLIFAQVTDLVADTGDKQAKATQMVFSGDVSGAEPANSPDYDSMEKATAWTFDSDKLDEDYTTTDIISPVALEVNEVVQVLPFVDKTGDFKWYVLKQGSSGGERTYVITGGSTYTFGAILNALDNSLIMEFTETQTFLFKPMWGESNGVPSEYYGFVDIVDSIYYFDFPEIFIHVNEIYPSSGNVTDFTIRLSKSKTGFAIGTLPSGAEAKLEDFINGSASTQSRSYFNDRVFGASYDQAQNLFFIDHPVY